jgi:hypothetical protein
VEAEDFGEENTEVGDNLERGGGGSTTGLLEEDSD